MNERIKLLHEVELTIDLPEYNLWRGQVVGTVVEILANGKAFVVEFSDREGRTYIGRFASGPAHGIAL